ncbi:FAD dependent oxidoreductase [Mycolicibacterium rhodesiae JS60]|nr:FAD dependent oxidoreductase [Mycolicibacterium rhodesiae JS60]
MSDSSVQVDVAIFGGGVAGLWLLARLRKLGHQAVLFESQSLGAGQTRYSQGIVHGGTKYALTGKLTASSESIAEMPAIWRAALEGRIEPDLRNTKLLSNHQFLWSTGKLTSRMTGFFASKLMESRTASVDDDARPEVLRNHHLKGQVYRLDEPVIEVASLIHSLAEPHREAIYKLPEGGRYRVEQREAKWHVELHDAGQPLDFRTRKLVFAAGGGNASLLKMIGRASPAMQVRPLHMVMVRGAQGSPLPGELYAHGLGTSANPRITITTHHDRDGNILWYMGGEIAEKGVLRSTDAQISAAGRELGELFPWLDLSRAQWGVLPIDRAEPKMANGGRPDNFSCTDENGVITAWPTKLALAPRLADSVIAAIQKGGVVPGPQTALPRGPHPGYAPLPWLEDQRWS